MAIRIKDIAKLAGVSPATVSLALNGSELVNEDTRKRIISQRMSTGIFYHTRARRRQCAAAVCSAGDTRHRERLLRPRLYG